MSTTIDLRASVAQPVSRGRVAYNLAGTHAIADLIRNQLPVNSQPHLFRETCSTDWLGDMAESRWAV